MNHKPLLLLIIVQTIGTTPRIYVFKNEQKTQSKYSKRM